MKSDRISGSRRPALLVSVAATLLGVLAACSGGSSGDPEAVSDGTNDVDVVPTNSAPTISGSPPTLVTVGDSYDFTPSASDPDGDTLTFTVSNRPQWADFDSVTGRLWGTVTMSDVGMYQDVVITVSDGIASASLQEFAIEVVQSAAGRVTLTWTPPTQTQDGSSLTNLAGYRIHYGTTSGEYDSVITINDPTISIYVVEGLGPDTYFFSSTAFTEDGLESNYSAEIVADVR